MIYSLPPKVGDTLTATVEPADAEVTYKWTLNGKGAITTETYTVPADANAGDAIKVVVTAEDGETAEDTVYVGGFTITKVEPTTDAASTSTGYKYIRAYFSDALTTLDPDDIEIRSKDTEQLYSIDTVKLSSNGTYADITLFGSKDEGDTRFLQGGVIYVMTIDNGEVCDPFEFELPMIWPNALVTKVDTAKGKVFLDGYANGFEVGDVYEENLGTLVGRSVNVGYNSDNEIEKLSVRKADVVYGVMKYVNKGTASTIDDKDYFEDQVTKTKYYMTTTGTTTINESEAICVVSGTSMYDLDGNDNKENTYNYAKLVLNSNGTVACAVLNPMAWNEGTVKVGDVDGTIVDETAKTSVDLDGYTIEKNGEYVTTADLEEDDIIFYSANGDGSVKFAEVYTVEVEGTPSDIDATSIAIDGTSYKWNDKNSTLVAAKYYKADDDVYTELMTDATGVAGQKVLNNFDPELGVIAYLDRLGNIAYIEGIDKESEETTDTWYVTTSAGAGYEQALDSYLKFKVSDGTEQTIEIPVSQLKTFDGVKAKAFTGTETTSGQPAVGDGSDYEFTFTVDPNDKDAQGHTKAKPFTDKTTASVLIPNDILVKITRDEDGKIIGITRGKVATVTAIDGENDNPLKPTTAKLTATNTTAKLTEDTLIWVHSTDKNNKITVTKETFGNYTRTTKDLDDLGTAGLTPVMLVDGSSVTDVLLTETFNANDESKLFAAGDSTDVEGIVTGFTEKLKADKSANYINSVTIMTIDGTKVTYNALDETSLATIAKDAYNLLKVDDATGDISGVKENDWTDKDKAITGGTSTEITIAGATIKPDSTALVLKKSGSTYTKIKLNQIATSTDPLTVSWHDEYKNTDDPANIIHYADFVVVEKDAKATAKTTAQAAINAANTAFTKLDGTAAAWENYMNAYGAAEDAITAYTVDAGGQRTDLTVTTFDNNHTAATVGLQTAKQKFTNADYSQACSSNTHVAVESLATLTARITCPTDGIVDQTPGCVTSVVVKANRPLNATSVVVTATFMDGSTKNATITTAQLTAEVYEGDEVYTKH